MLGTSVCARCGVAVDAEARARVAAGRGVGGRGLAAATLLNSDVLPGRWERLVAVMRAERLYGRGDAMARAVASDTMGWKERRQVAVGGLRAADESFSLSGR